MQSKSEQERERLKEEYKEHYRKIRDAKEKVRRSRYVKNVSEAVQKMNADDLLESVDEFLGKVRNRMASIEARLEVAMDHFTEENDNLDDELEKELKKQQARETLRQIKHEMGLLYNDVEKQAGELNVDKTVGRTGSKDKEKPTGNIEE